MNQEGVSLASAPALAERCPGPLSLRSALGAWLGRPPAASELECRAKFHVSRDTLERMVTGEVVPEPELEARIWEEVRCRPAAEGGDVRGAVLVREADGWKIGVWIGGVPVRWPVAAARALVDAIAPLLVQHDRQFPR